MQFKCMNANQIYEQFNTVNSEDSPYRTNSVHSVQNLQSYVAYLPQTSLQYDKVITSNVIALPRLPTGHQSVTL
jgi:hypothetical protein